MLIALVQGMVKDTAARLTDPDDYNASIQEGLKAYSKVRPRQIVADLAADGSHDLPLPADWCDGLSIIESIEYPVGNVPETLLDSGAFRLYAAPEGVKIRLTDKPLLGASVRLLYTALHTEETVPAGDIEAVANKAAAACCRKIAAGYGQSSEPLIQADSVQYGDKVDSYRRLASSFDDEFNKQLGLGSDTPVKGSMTTAQPPERRLVRLTHLAAVALMLCSFAASGHATDTIGNDPWPVDLSVQAGEDFRVRLTMRTYSTVNDRTGQVMNLTGYNYRAQAGAQAGAAVFATFSTVVVDPANGQVDLSLSKAQSTKNSGKSGFWDLLQRDPSGAVRYLMKGLVKFSSTVSRL